MGKEADGEDVRGDRDGDRDGDGWVDARAGSVWDVGVWNGIGWDGIGKEEAKG